MSGHSKWANIKRRKAVQDAKKGQAYAKVSRDIIVAAKLGGGDPNGNFRLRTAIDRAKVTGMPSDNIKRAIEKGIGNASTDQWESVIYEGYGPGGVAVLIETLTDNRNRTAGDIRSYFNKHHGNLGSDGCVAWIFEEKGLVRVLKKTLSEEVVFEKAIEAGATDFRASLEDDADQAPAYEIFTEPTALNNVCQALAEAGISVDSAEVTRFAQNGVSIKDPEQAKHLMKLLDAIESQDDVQAVFANFEMEDALLEQVS